MNSNSNNLAVAYLLRQQNDIEHFSRFILSYRKLGEEIPHDLVIIFKGFSDRNTSPCMSLLEEIPYVPFLTEDIGFDIGSYLNLAKETSYDRFLFLNSFSEFQTSDCITKLSNALDQHEMAGAVGATGSYEPSGAGTPHPNYHIRTTGFMISRTLLLDLDLWEMREKKDTSMFEAGPDSLTQQLLRRGMEPLVVDRNGKPYTKESWQNSGTYRHANQEKLLISDNRTRAYQDAEPEMRQWLSDLAWSPKRPGESPLKSRKLSRRIRRWLGTG